MPGKGFAIELDPSFSSPLQNTALRDCGFSDVGEDDDADSGDEDGVY